MMKFTMFSLVIEWLNLQIFQWLFINFYNIFLSNWQILFLSCNWLTKFTRFLLTIICWIPRFFWKYNLLINFTFLFFFQPSVKFDWMTKSMIFFPHNKRTNYYVDFFFFFSRLIIKFHYNLNRQTGEFHGLHISWITATDWHNSWFFKNFDVFIHD